MASEDPYLWTVDQLTYELCYNPQPVWATQAKKALMPPAEIFERAIRDNVLDGESFMSMDIANIEVEMGFLAFGTKRNIYKIIKFFRSISAEYRRQDIADYVMPFINDIASPQITASHLSRRPQSIIYGHQTPRQNCGSPAVSYARSVTPAQWPGLNQQAGTIDQSFAQSSIEEGPIPQMELVLGSQEQRLQDGMNGHISQESIPEGRQASPVISSNSERHLAMSQAHLPQKSATQSTTSPKAPKRIVPTFVAHITQDRAKEHDCSRAIITSAQDLSIEHVDSEDEFSYTASTEPVQARRYVASNIKMLLLHNRPIFESDHESPPQRKRRLRKDVVGSAVQAEDKVNPFLVPEQQPLEDGESETHFDETDIPYELAQLLVRNPPVEDDNGYPLYGDSGDEGLYDEETYNEIDADKEEDRGITIPAATLTEDAVNTTIDEAVEEMITQWHNVKLPKTQKKAYKMWEKATRHHSGAQAIANSNFWLDRLERTISRVRGAITDSTWSTLADVKVQCKSMEESVFQREEHKYYLSVLQGNEPPRRPEREALIRAAKRSRPDLPEGEEELESDSEPLSNFVDDDASDEDSIPYEPPITAEQQADAEPTIDLETTALQTAEADAHAVSDTEVTSTADPNETKQFVEDISTDTDDQIMESAARRRLQRSSLKEPTTPSRKLQPAQHTLETPNESNTELGSDQNSTPLSHLSRYRNQGTQEKPIVLLSSPSAWDSEDRGSDRSMSTPLLNTETACSSGSAAFGRLMIKSIDDGPDLKDIEGIKDLAWETIEDGQDCYRALAKAVYEMELDLAVKLFAFLAKIVARDNADTACELLKRAVLSYGREDSVQNIANRDQPLAQSLGMLFVTYNNAIDCMTEPLLSDEMLETTYEAIDMGCHKFFQHLASVLQRYCNSQLIQEAVGKKRNFDDTDLLDSWADDSDNLMISEDQDPTRSARKRKKKVLQSQEAETAQLDDRIRIAAQEAKRTALLRKMRDMADNADGNTDDAALHPVSFDPDAPTIYLDPHIGRKVKPHQENGIQFMWRELTAGKGCMLAHTMGLGKTMQVISLLITLAQASSSGDPQVQKQVPKALRMSRTLILCPPGLLDNWYDEILMWTPPGSLVLGDIGKITANMDPPERRHTISRWAQEGGVLLMTYQLFKQIVQKTSKAIPEALRSVHAEMLIHKPNIVVADEAHHMKNPKSGLAQAAKQLTTKARIALTGSPLSNHLEEYRQMVDWISPGYLGTLVQFKAKYSEPIKEGLYNDSSLLERKLSARKLLVLKRDLDPKICRADISAIAKDMPNKAEFFITIPLTTLQTEAYSAYAKHMLRDHADGPFKQASIWSWLSVLSLLLNHPSAFVQKLQRRIEVREATEERDASSSTDDLTLPADVPLSSIGLSSEATNDILRPFRAMTQKELKQVDYSYRSLLTARIVEESMQIKEKVLIFSHSIPTLDYLEHMLNTLPCPCKYARIDGSTSMPSRQDTVKSFNRNRDIEVMLISTTAGGLGLNLHGANRVIIYDFNFNPTWEEQAIGRAYRLGQQRHVFVYRFRAGGTFEETVYNTSIFKTQLFARVVDQKKPTRFASKKLSDYLFQPREVEQSDLGDCAGKDPEVLDRILVNETCIRKVELTETFQKEEEEELTEEEKAQVEEEYQDGVLARNDPGRFAFLQRERLTYRIPVQARPAQPSQMAYASLPQDLRFTGLHGLPNVPQAPSISYDDMQFSRGPFPPRIHFDSMPQDSPQPKGQNEQDEGLSGL